MSSNGNGQFREEELVTRRMKVNGDWQSRTFPVVGGRLRLAHESNEKLSVTTELVSWDGQYAVCKGVVATEKGEFSSYATANAQRDSRLAESLIELAGTRSVARALRLAGYGVDMTGAEEVNHVENETNSPQRVFPDEEEPPRRSSGNGGASKPHHCGNGRATKAQCRALYALTKKADYTPEDVDSMLSPFNAASFDELTRESASQLITSLQTEAG